MTRMILALLALLVAPSIGATTIQSQDLPNDLTIEGTYQINTRLKLGPLADLQWPDGSISTSPIGSTGFDGMNNYMDHIDFVAPAIFSERVHVNEGIHFSTGARGLGFIGGSLEDSGGLIFISSTGSLGTSVFNFVTDSSSMYIAFSTIATLSPGEAAGIFYSSMTGFDIASLGSNPGSIQISDGEARIGIQNLVSGLTVWTSSASLNSPTVLVGQGFGGVFKSEASTNDLSIGQTKLNAVTGKALCLNASGVLRTCSGAVNGSGGCSCP